MQETIVGLFKDANSLKNAIRDLENAGFSDQQVNVIMTDKMRDEVFLVEESNKAAEGMAVGATVTGLFAAIATGLVAAGAVVTSGGLLIAGPLVAAFAAGGAGAAAGGAIGGLIGLGISDYQAKDIEKNLRAGATLLAVTAFGDAEVKAVKKIFKDDHATDISTASVAA